MTLAATKGLLPVAFEIIRKSCTDHIIPPAICRLAGIYEVGGGSTVQSGPFAGMRLDVEALPVHVAPKFIGTYESELHSAIEMAISRGPDIVLNVGCAEGYYAVGLALRLPKALIYAFDADPKARRATARNAALNGVVDRLHIGGAIQVEDLEPLLPAGKAMVVMDCEGAEIDLLDPLKAPALTAAHIVVEVHPGVAPEAEAILTKRFAVSHTVARFNQEDLQTKLASAPPVANAADLETAVDERRGPDVFWFCMTPK